MTSSRGQMIAQMTSVSSASIADNAGLRVAVTDAARESSELEPIVPEVLETWSPRDSTSFDYNRVELLHQQVENDQHSVVQSDHAYMTPVAEVLDTAPVTSFFLLLPSSESAETGALLTNSLNSLNSSLPSLSRPDSWMR